MEIKLKLMLIFQLVSSEQNRRINDKMLNNISIGGVMNSLIPISRFNKGEANKIFDEVRETGFKIVLKNNTPACVLLTPENYEEMLEIIEDYKLLIEAENRTVNSKIEDYIPTNRVLSELGINQKELDDVEVDIE